MVDAFDFTPDLELRESFVELYQQKKLFCSQYSNKTEGLKEYLKFIKLPEEAQAEIIKKLQEVADKQKGLTEK